MKPWCEKYKAESIEDLAVDPSSLKKLMEIIDAKGVALIHGPTGSGKTSAIEMIAKEKDFELIEMNASDFRDSENIRRVIGGSLQQQSLFKRKKLILIDELNGISGREDRGGLLFLNKLLGKNKFPVIMTAEDPFTKKLAATRKKSKVIEFNAVETGRIVTVLKKVCEGENVPYEEDDLKTIARRVGGDIRGAINDLQVHSILGKIELAEEAEDNEREREGTILDALRLVFKSRKWENVSGVYNNLKEDHKEIMLWLEQNIPAEYSDEELYNAYMSLSKADIFNRRIMRWQHWRYLVYVYNLLSYGVAFSKKENKKGFVPYKRSDRPLKIWLNNMKTMKRKSICDKLAGKMHSSKKGFVKKHLPYLKLMARNGRLPDLGLSPEEVEWLTK
ncbi:replication factor C large subunit [Candidatus Woesearchaeota archaeon]|nr:replication factor C large subunit [Candidatus Woesearchaeota archaeon]